MSAENRNEPDLLDTEGPHISKETSKTTDEANIDKKEEESVNAMQAHGSAKDIFIAEQIKEYSNVSEESASVVKTDVSTDNNESKILAPVITNFIGERSSVNVNLECVENYKTNDDVKDSFSNDKLATFVDDDNFMLEIDKDDNATASTKSDHNMKSIVFSKEQISVCVSNKTIFEINKKNIIQNNSENLIQSQVMNVSSVSDEKIFINETKEYIQDSVEINNVTNVSVHEQKNIVESEEDSVQKEIFTNDNTEDLLINKLTNNTKEFPHNEQLLDNDKNILDMKVLSIESSDKISLFTDQSNIVENNKIQENKCINDETFANKEESNSLTNKETININDIEFLQIAKQLNDRDNFIYDSTFIVNDSIKKSPEVKQINLDDNTKSVSSNQQNAVEKVNKVINTLSPKNISIDNGTTVLTPQQNLVNEKSIQSEKVSQVKDTTCSENVFGDSETKSLLTVKQNLVNEKSMQSEEVCQVKDTTSFDNGSSDSESKSLLIIQENLAVNEKLLQTEKDCQLKDTITSENVSSDNETKSLLTTQQNLSVDKKILQTEKIDQVDDTITSENISVSNDTKSLQTTQQNLVVDETCKIKDSSDKNVSLGNNKVKSLPIEQMSENNHTALLSTEEKTSENGTSKNDSSLLSLVSETKSEESSSMISHVKIVSTSSKTLKPLINNEINNDCGKTLKPKEPLEDDQTNNSKISQNNEVNTADASKEVLKNNEIKVDNNVNDSKKISENPSQNVEKPQELISKLQSMEWLKTQPANNTNMNQGAKYQLQKLSKKDERNEDYFEGTKRNNNKRRSSNGQNRYRNDRSNPASKKVEPPKQDNMEEPKSIIQPNETSSNVWNKDSANKLFPNVQSEKIDRAKEEEELELAVAQSICTAQQESERRKLMEKNLTIKVQDYYDDDEWGKVHRNLPDSTNSTNVGDKNNNENLAQGFVDKFGRVDGYTEKHLFMGKGARRKEQEFLKAHTENKCQPLSNTSIIQTQPQVDKSTQQNVYSFQETKKDLYQTEQQAAYKNQCKDQTNLIKNQHQTMNKNQSRDQTAKETLNQIQEKPIPIYGRSGREPNSDSFDRSNKNVQKPGFRQETPKNFQSQNMPPKSLSQNIVNKQQECFYSNANQNLSQNMPPKSSSQNIVNKQQECFYSNTNQNQSQNISRNQESSSRTANYANANQSNAIKHQEYNRNQHFDNRNQSERYQDSNRSQTCNVRNQDSKIKSQENFNRNQSGSYPDKMHENPRNQNYSKNPDTANKNQYQDSRQRFNSEILNRNQERFGKNQSEESWDVEEHKKSNLNSQRNHNNNNQQNISNQQSYSQKGQKTQIQESKSNSNFNQQNSFNPQDNKKPIINKETNIPNQTNITNERQSTNSSLPKNNTVLKDPNQSADIIKSRELEHVLHYPNSNATMTIPATKSDLKESSTKTELNLTFGNVQEILNTELRPNVVMTFEGNQNVQRALGLNPTTCNPLQVNNQQLKNDVSVSNVTDSTGTLPINLDSNVLQNVPFSQSVPFVNYNTEMATSAMMNVNALPFESANFNVNQGLNRQFTNDTESALPDASFGIFPPSNVDISTQQIRMNEISNASQEMSRLINKVSCLSKQLASAQAELLAAQVKFFNQNVSRPTNELQSQILHPNLPTASCNQNLSIQNQSLPVELLTMHYSTPPGYSASPQNVQQKPILNDNYEVPKNYSSMQDFDKFLSNATVEQRLSLQSMYAQPGNPYQHQASNFHQQYNSDVNTVNAVPRVRMVPQNTTDLRDHRGNQFYNQ